jgi:MSHA biogenesis protein MshG
LGLFAYTGRNTSGELVKGDLDSSDSSRVADQLVNIGVTPINIVENRPVMPFLNTGRIAQLLEPKIRPLDIQMFSRQMYTLLKAGVPIMRALAGLQESAITKSLTRLLQDLRTSLDAGRELSQSMQGHPRIFSNFYLSMIRVGEMTGRIDQIFLRLFDHMEFEREMSGRVRAALRYPLFVIIAMGIAIVVINIFVIPAFAKVYSGMKAELPLMTQILIGFSNFTVRFWPVLLAILFGSIFAFRFYIRTKKGRFVWDKFKLGLPVAGKIIHKATLARFARSFALASKSGIPVVQGLIVVSQVVDNSYIASRIDLMREGVERGETLFRTAISTGIFTPVVIQMIAVGEESGEVDSLMQEIADMYEREVEYELKTLSAQIEPILIIGLGGLVLVLALGVFLPIWDLGKVALHK